MRRKFRGLLWMVLGPLALLLLAGLAWVASNGRWADAAPRPVPAELQLPPPRLALQSNAFVDLQGLGAPAGQDVHAAGLKALQGDETAAGEGRLRWPDSLVWRCRPDREDCVARWLAQPDVMREFLAATEELGKRCKRIAAAPDMEEVLSERPASGPLTRVSFAALPMPRYSDLTQCIQWLALKAATEPQPQQVWARLAQADRLARLHLGGARSTIGSMVGVAAVQRSWLLAGQMVANRALDPAALMPLLAPLPQAALNPRAWALHEARFTREVIRDLVHEERGCHRAEDASWLDRLGCGAALGLMPEQTVQDSDERWLALLAAAPAQGPVSCEALQSPPWREPESFSLSWRNTLGRWMMDVPTRHWELYAARQLDLELLRQTLIAQVLRQSPPGTVQLTRENGAQRFAACRARLHPGEAEATLRLPLL